MKFLGRGWQYSAYDLGNGRVLKKRNTKLQAYRTMLVDCFPYTKMSFTKFPDFYKWGGEEARGSLQKILNSTIDQSVFGHPKILDNGIDYEQDKAVPIKDYLKTASFLDSKLVVDKFIELNKILVKSKLIDKSFNIGKNFGLNEKGEIVLIDLGEIWSSPENIQKQITNKAWMRPYVLKPMPSKELLAYFITRMNESF